MGYILLLLSILLIGAAFWLWHLSNKHIGSFAVKTSLSPEQEVITYSKPEKSDLIHILRKAALLGKVLVPLLLILLVLVIFAGLSFYVYIKGYRIVLLIIILIFSALVFSISRWLRLRQNSRILITKSSEKIIVQNLTSKDIVDLLDELSAKHIVEDFPRNKKYSRGLKFSGNVILPKQVYVNDSLSISLELKPELKLPTDIEVEFTIQDKESSKSVTLQIRQNATQQQFLEIELQAAAFTVDGETRSI